MSRISILTMACACLVFATPPARAATVKHRHLDTSQVKGKAQGTHTHGKTRAGHAITTTHGPKGKVRSVAVGKSRHSKAYKVANRHTKSKRVGLGPVSGIDRTFVVADLDEDSADSCQAFSFIGFLVRIGNVIYLYLIPSSWVSSTVAITPGDPPDPTDCGGCEARAGQSVHGGTSDSPSWSTSGMAALGSSERRRRA